MNKTKKILLISLTAVLLIASVIGVTFAAVKWDITDQDVAITTDNAASNVKIDATVEANSADTTKLLIPTSVAKFPASNAVNGIRLGKVQIALTTDGNSTVAELLARVKITFTVDKIQKVSGSSTTDIANWNKYFNVTMRTSDSYLTDNSNAETVLSQVTNPYYAFLEYKDLSTVNDVTEQGIINGFQGAKFKVFMTIKIANK